MLARRTNSHKGENGRVLIVGGSDNYVGAPALTGLAVLRSGADLAIIACPETAGYAINSISPDLITVKLSGKTLARRHEPRIAKLAESADVVVLGPGLGTNPETKMTVRNLCRRISKPKVIDADALKALDKIPENCILTPHAGEFEILFGCKPTREELKKRASEDKIILLKGPCDLISNGKEVKENCTGNPGMTVGGTGDVLAGLVAGLVAQGVKPLDAAFLAAQVNGESGDLLLKEKGYGFTASDLLEVIPRVMKEK
mgnify:CR=1 FL=1